MHLLFILITFIAVVGVLFYLHDMADEVAEQNELDAQVVEFDKWIERMEFGWEWKPVSQNKHYT